MADNNPEKNTLKSGKSIRSRAGKERKPAGTPKLIIAAVVVIVAGAVILFGPRLSPEKTGIGEQRSVVVTPPDTSAAQPDSTTMAMNNSKSSEGHASRPRSGNVDIAAESQSIVAESPDGSGLSSTEAAAQDKKLATPPTAKPKPKPKPKPKAKPQEQIIPQKSGGWIVQVGAYGVAANADKEALRLQTKGWDARVRGTSTPEGKMVFHVQIGYFSSRSDGTLFARQNKKAIPGAYTQHK